MVRERLSLQLNLRVAPTETLMLERLSEATGLSKSDVIRQGVRRWYADLFGDKAPRAKRRRKRKRT